MMKALATCLVVLASAATASGDARFHNATPKDVVVEVTMPNGQVKKLKMAAAVDSISSEMVLFAPGVDSVAVVVHDDAGAQLWSGKIGTSDEQVIAPATKGVTLLHAGFYAGSNSPRAAAFVNLTGEAITVDLVGDNGKGAHRGLAPKATFDVAKAVVLDPAEASFAAEVRSGKGEPETVGKVTPGYQYVIWKARGGYRMLQAGKLPPPPEKKAGKKAKK